PPSAGETFDEGCRNIYNFILTELDESLADLKDNGVNRMNPATNRMIKARLLFNANVFIKENHFSECATICDEIIQGKYGKYSIANDFREVFGMNNDQCKEVIFAFAFEQGMSAGSALNMRNVTGFAYNAWEAFGHTTNASGWNCVCVVPSHDNSGNVLATGGTDTGGKSFVYDYGDKLGAVYDRFDPKDIRRQPFYCDTKGKWNGGLFLIGAQKNYKTGEPLLADADRDGQNLVYVDQVGTFMNLGKELQTIMSPRWGETNSGYRLVKYPVYPDEVGFDYRNADEVEFRLAEVYYMLAECKIRAGEEGAKDLVNTIRKRYFSASDWNAVKDQPGPGFSSFDLDWMLSEWGKEFIGEGRRRRTDLRRHDKFTQGQWWFFGRTDEGYPAQRDRKYEWFPLPERALTVNPGLKQNPDYVI
ncbi:MAG: RagB/SusD family nutrient uptake outer membrane protein, partial [Bacteroidales bacterium]|nr:RagB/SusD family nutrient uptake outer membrane protein [Bacteroidales bacterium]